MSPEIPADQPLTPEQVEIADFLVETCNLGDVANVELEMMGLRGTVHYGLGRCAEYFGSSTPEEIRAMVMKKLEQQNP